MKRVEAARGYGDRPDRMSDEGVRGMKRVEAAFRAARGKRALLIGYATAGFPDLETSRRICSSLLEHCDLLELGIPFSDPVLDGPVIQESSSRALEAGFRVSDAFDLARELRERTEKPLLAMTYYNPVHRMGHEAFAERAARAGFDGLLVPDLPLEEAGGLRAAADSRDLAAVLFASMSTPDDRLRDIAGATRGFLYCFAVKGTTGLRESLSAGLAPFTARVRSLCDIPIALGLGISSPGQCREAGELADAVVVGSALVKACLDALDSGADPAAAAGRLAASLREALG
ncbi:MAG: tryptophan synthase subunit alpha [Actinobacteria bacterium]|nr:tryptophan synthase subunit alpha [Actinomycetota bacterium]